MGAGNPNPEQPPTPEPATAPAPAPQQDYAALQAAFAENQEKLKQAVAAIAAIQAERQPQQTQPEPTPITPEFEAQAQSFFRTQLAPFLQDIRGQIQAMGGWQGGQQLRQLTSELDAPSDVEVEATKLMNDYAHAGRPISHLTAVRHVLGIREENRLRQEAVTRRAKGAFNSSMLPAFSGSGGLPNLQPQTTQRPKDNDILGWQKFYEDNDMPLS